MAVTAKFVPEQVDLLPNVAATLSLRLYNGDTIARRASVAVSGDLAEHAELETKSVSLDPNQIVDVPVRVEVPSTVAAGSYAISAELTYADGTAEPAGTDAGATVVGAVAEHVSKAVIAVVAVEVLSHRDYSLALQPARSRGSTGGRHLLRVLNTGNVPLTLALSAEAVGDGIGVEVGAAELAVAPGLVGEATVRATPGTTYWSGQQREHEFAVHVHAADARDDTLVGTFEQRPRVPNWIGPATAGALAALLIGAIAWFALQRPWVEDHADRVAADAIEDDRAALRERIADLEAAAADAKELPLGSPVDFRIDLAPTGGDSLVDGRAVKAGTIVSITDVVFQNPTGAVGTVSLRRGDDVLLQSELANFRDLDLHFVAPFTFDDSAKIVVAVECRSPGSGASDCPIGVSLVGFVDETR